MHFKYKARQKERKKLKPLRQIVGTEIYMSKGKETRDRDKGRRYISRKTERELNRKV